MPRYPVPGKEIRCEMEVLHSRFITTLGPAFTVDEAKAFIHRVHIEYADATHNVPLYLIGWGESVTAHCSDAGEPSGTAGRPALAVLRGSGLGDVVAVITRYFGGIKLGTGGLVRAYSDAVRLALENTPRAERVPTHTIMFAMPYSLLERVRRLIPALHGQVIDEMFAADITVTAQFPIERFPAFQTSLSELSNGTLNAEVIETKELLIPVTP